MSDGPDPLGRLLGLADDDDEDQSEYTPEDGSSGDVRGGVQAGEPEEIVAALPPNLQNWVERMVEQADEVTYHGVLTSDAFRDFAEGYGYDVEWVREQLEDESF